MLLLPLLQLPLRDRGPSRLDLRHNAVGNEGATALGSSALRPREHRLVILYTCRAVRGNLGSTAYGATGRLTRPMEHTSIDERRPAIRDGWKTHRIVQAGGSRALVQGRVSELRIPAGTTAFGAINYLKNVQRTTTIGANLADYVNGTFCHVLISRKKETRSSC